MKKNLIENVLNLFNKNNTEQLASNNIDQTNINDDIFNDGSYIDDVLNSEEGIKLSGPGLMANLCKTQIH